MTLEDAVNTSSKQLDALIGSFASFLDILRSECLALEAQSESLGTLGDKALTLKASLESIAADTIDKSHSLAEAASTAILQQSDYLSDTCSKIDGSVLASTASFEQTSQALNEFETRFCQENKSLLEKEDETIQLLIKIQDSCIDAAPLLIDSLSQLQKAGTVACGLLMATADQAVLSTKNRTNRVRQMMEEKLEPTFLTAGEELNKSKNFTSELLTRFSSRNLSQLDDFGDASEELGKRLSDEATQRTNEAIVYLQSQLQDSFNTIVEDMIHDCVKEFLVDVLANTVTAQAAASTTSALAPILPELIAAKAAIRLINNIL